LPPAAGLGGRSQPASAAVSAGAPGAIPSWVMSSIWSK
jgi:hypothetical protein